MYLHSTLASIRQYRCTQLLHIFHRIGVSLEMRSTRLRFHVQASPHVLVETVHRH